MNENPEPVQEKYPDAKLVAEIKLYIDMKSENSSGTLARVGGESYIIICPRGIDQIKTKKHFFSVVAHELGHWIGAQQESPAATDSCAKLLHMVTGDGRFVLPSEQEAWDWAEKIIPGSIDQAEKIKALQTYGYTPQHARLR